MIVFNFLLCRLEAMAGWIDVHAQFNGRERLKVQCLGVTLRGLKDQLNEFNQGVSWVREFCARRRAVILQLCNMAFTFRFISTLLPFDRAEG